ncbi:nitroreductase family protein [Methylibium sp.]|uniref:nitroreductase family protein n=1 Tax=Methylibium sp. TaxID=2067992 RepID=UPI0017B2780A|nr:nitroreductase family protein [Methylibium sp.]MBA3589131.1 nitroreductase family protein [Methylibium sp.]
MTHPIITAIEERRTTVLFDPSRDISDEQITELVHLATKAPTSFNLQNWRFIAVRTSDAKARLRAVAWDQAKITESSVTFIICGQMADEHTLPERLAPAVEAGIMPAQMVDGWEAGAGSLYNEQAWRQRDEAVRTATFGAATLIFAAHAMGLGSGPMIGFDPEAVAREFTLASDEIPVMLLSIGYGTPENWPQKPRRPLSQVLSFV